MSDREFPPYAYVPGRHPHPTSDPRGHSFGKTADPAEPLDVNAPDRSAEFQRAVALFDRGFYWEAHEAWEGLWHAAGRKGPVADLLQGLIKLAAAGVKAREGNAAGVGRHARRAVELLRRCIAHSEACGRLVERLGGAQLIARCDHLAEEPIVDATPSLEGRPVLGIQLGDLV